ncbi:MAG: hypothetical protein ACRDN6_07110 [Gaiellaceae bacterium]
MFFATIIVVPVLAGLAAGLATGSRRIPLSLAGLFTVLGVAGAITAAFNPDHRLENVSFSLAAGVGAAALAYFGWVAGRLASHRRSAI